jgi:hypothetical protein
MKRFWQTLLPFLLVLTGAIQSANASEPVLTALLVNGKIQLSWSADFSHYFLFEASEPVPAAWHELVVPTLIANSTVRVTLDPAGSARFFQLISGDPLFDGISLDAFRGYQKSDFPTASWSTNNAGELSMISDAPAVHLITRVPYASFHLKWEWKTGASGNSGVIYRGNENHSNIASAGPEYQLLNNSAYPGLASYLYMGAAYRFFAPANPKISAVGEWNRCEVLMQGNHVEHWLNGARIVNYDIGSPAWNSAKTSAGANYNVSDMGAGIGGGLGQLIFLHQSAISVFRKIQILSLP